MANLLQKIESVKPGLHTIVVEGVSKGRSFNMNIDRKEFQAFADNNGSRKWSLEVFNGHVFLPLTGLMDWDEYYESKETVLDDMAEFISKKRIKPSFLTAQA